MIYFAGRPWISKLTDLTDFTDLTDPACLKHENAAVHFPKLGKSQRHFSLVHQNFTILPQLFDSFGRKKTDGPELNSSHRFLQSLN